MKKFIILFVCAVMSIFVFAACNNKPDGPEYSEYVSYYQTHQYTALNEDFAVSVYSGVRESEFRSDGKVGETRTFYVVSATPLNSSLKLPVNYKLTDGTKTAEGSLEQDKLSASFSSEADLSDIIENLKTITLSYTDKEVTLTLENRLENMIDWQEALKIATAELKDVIAENTDESGKLTREIYVKFIRNRFDHESPYYWYVALVGEDYKYSALLINPENGEILTKKD